MFRIKTEEALAAMVVVRTRGRGLVAVPIAIERARLAHWVMQVKALGRNTST